MNFVRFCLNILVNIYSLNYMHSLPQTRALNFQNTSTIELCKDLCLGTVYVSTTSYMSYCAYTAWETYSHNPLQNYGYLV